jgi:hypothetical protein
VKVAPGARSNSLSPIGGGPGRGTATAPATFILRGGADAMAVTAVLLALAISLTLAVPPARAAPLARCESHTRPPASAVAPPLQGYAALLQSD